MAIRGYREFVLVADDVKKDADGLRKLTVQVFRTPGVGEGKKEVRELSPELSGELSKLLYRLEHRKLGVEAIIALGEALADLLLPAKSRELFTRSLDKLQPEQGLRLRLRLDPLLADIPWEYIYIQRGEGEKDTTGFLALDPRISIVRHEALPVSGDIDIDTTPRTRRVLAAFASPEEPGYDSLDLDQERDNLKEILRDLPQIELDVLADATVDGLNSKLQNSADIFHFAGHGRYKVTGQGTSIRSVVGGGEIMLVKEDGTAAPMPADQLAVNLQGHGVQLVVLGACQTGRRDDQNVWSGVVAALMEVGIPAAVTMQYKIRDDAAIAFSRSFYQALAAGFPLDWAVSAGRLAAFNLCHAKRDDAELGKYWRDWGVPVVYLRSEGEFVLPAIVDADQRKAVSKGLRTMASFLASIAVPVDQIVDFEKMLDELKKMLSQRTDKRLMFIRESDGKGKSCLLRKMEAYCRARDIPCCLIEFKNDPFDAPYLTLAREVFDLLKVTPRHLAEALKPLSVASANIGSAITTIEGAVSDSTITTQIVYNFPLSEEILYQNFVKTRLKRTFVQDICSLDKTAVVLIDDLEEASTEAKKWLVEALLQPVQAKEVKNIIVVTAGTCWPKIDEMQWGPYSHFVDRLPLMSKAHMREYGKRIGYQISDAELETCWRASHQGNPFLMGWFIKGLSKT